MNHFLAIITSIIIVAGINNGDPKSAAGNDDSKATTTSQYTLTSKVNRKPQVTNIIPSTFVEEKYVAKVTTATGDTVRYAPIFVPKKIKF